MATTNSRMRTLAAVEDRFGSVVIDTLSNCYVAENRDGLAEQKRHHTNCAMCPFSRQLTVPEPGTRQRGLPGKSS
jgi:hypothetical protein